MFGVNRIIINITSSTKQLLLEGFGNYLLISYYLDYIQIFIFLEISCSSLYLKVTTCTLRHLVVNQDARMETSPGWTVPYYHLRMAIVSASGITCMDLMLANSESDNSGTSRAKFTGSERAHRVSYISILLGTEVFKVEFKPQLCPKKNDSVQFFCVMRS